MELNEIRTAISETDQQLLSLLSKRRKLALAVAEAKLSQNKPIRDQQREQELLLSLIEKGKSLELDAHYVTRLFQVVIEDSVLQQQAKVQGQLNGDNSPVVRVAFLGGQGSYSYWATQKYFTRRAERIIELGCDSFNEIVKAVETGHADYAVLPIENTSSGSINEVYDILQHTRLSIVGELTHPIEHCLLGLPGTDLSKIRQVCSHPQVIAQCSQFLLGLTNVKIDYCESSSAAFAKVKELQDPSIIAIGGEEGGKLYGLEVLTRQLANQKANISRFIVVARKSVNVAKAIPAKTTFIMYTGQQPGALVEALLVLKQHGISMSKLESRPINGNPWEEMFYVDVSANLNDYAMTRALEELNNLTKFIKVLGCYPSDDITPTQPES
ncbi:chorismate mutase [Alishewanella sp. SMS8]|uniref:chorismate mutase n=1 Tax=unclassified Alishewanella TaxID=2628974 RepID=UPI002740BEE3|nr:chorismate mutase [Alishewanella sp. SMS8]MDP4945184.1 chorismate mutase [Alishewanella sp.]MDP5037314.1 chorismate mutase [Alishewanella sp.]MDP5187507.1 chorismate mutase [Alishewanella sp.]MDP5460838.1 chorismate mutase [Alishewanella sp. SMS8]